MKISGFPYKFLTPSRVVAIFISPRLGKITEKSGFASLNLDPNLSILRAVNLLIPLARPVAPVNELLLPGFNLV